MRNIKQKTKNRTKGKTAIKRNKTTKKGGTIKRNTKKRGLKRAEDKFVGDKLISVVMNRNSLKKRGGGKRDRYEDEDEDGEDEIDVAVELQKKINAIRISSLHKPHNYPVETADDIITILEENNKPGAQIFELENEGEVEFTELLRKKLLQKILEIYNKPVPITNGQRENEILLNERKNEMLKFVELLKEHGYELDNNLKAEITPKPDNWDDLFNNGMYGG